MYVCMYVCTVRTVLYVCMYSMYVCMYVLYVLYVCSASVCPSVRMSVRMSVLLSVCPSVWFHVRSHFFFFCPASQETLGGGGVSAGLSGASGPDVRFQRLRADVPLKTPFLQPHPLPNPHPHPHPIANALTLLHSPPLIPKLPPSPPPKLPPYSP